MKKGTDVPDVAHLLGVTSIVLEDGGDEDHARVVAEMERLAAP